MEHHDSRREAIWKAAEAALIARRRRRVLSQSLAVAAVPALILGSFLSGFGTQDGRLTAATRVASPPSVLSPNPRSTGLDGHELHRIGSGGGGPGGTELRGVGLQWAELEWVRSDPRILERCAVPSRPVPAAIHIGDEELLALLSLHGRSTGIARVGKQVFVLDTRGDIPHF